MNALNKKCENLLKKKSEVQDLRATNTQYLSKLSSIHMKSFGIEIVLPRVKGQAILTKNRVLTSFVVFLTRYFVV